MENFNLSHEQLDVLKEIGTIGGGSAATALSQILAKRVSINVPQVSLVSSERISASEFLIPADEVTLAVELKILGPLKGGMLVLFAEKSALLMIDVLMKRSIGSTQLLNLLEASAVSECSHILSGSYLNAVGELLELHQLIPSIPQTIVDRMDRLNRVLLKRFTDQQFHYLLPIENNLIIEDIQVNLFVIFLLEHESVKKILKIVGI
jgi:chemotaxis protein CheC